MTRNLAMSVSAALLTIFCVASPASSLLANVRAHSANLMREARAKCPAWPAGSGLLLDGDFHESPDPADAYVEGGKGERLSPGWRVSKGNVDLVGSTFWPSPDDICKMDLDGLEPGGIKSRRFPTSPSSVYTLTFLLSGNSDCAPRIKTLVVTAAGQAQSYSWDVAGGNDAQHGIYKSQSWNFTANASVTRVFFTSEDPKRRSPGCGPVVAAVSVTQSTSRTVSRPAATSLAHS
jgi:hypothetical protein